MKVLITADIHLGEYNDYNYSKNFRLNQFDKLADRLIELGKQYSCEEVWILGDFLRVPNSKSRIQHKLKNFIKKLCNEFTYVRYILGQHDLDSKSDNQDIEDTIVSIPELGNFIYMDKQFIEGTKRIAFANWTPSQDLSWIDGKVDLLCGHYTKSTLFGQDIDESKFDLMIHGDIHNDQVLGKFISVGNPIQHDFSSQSEGTCIILDTDTIEWKHIKIDEDHTRFLRMYYTDNPNLEGFSDELTYYKYRPPIQKELSDVNKPLINWKDIDDLIIKITSDKGLLNIHDEIKSSIINQSDIDFDVQLRSLDIHGYRSVVDFHIDFTEGDRVILLGNNGSGKSSILNALKSGFDKSRYIQYEKSDLTDSVLITIKFVYQNKFVELTKGDYFRLVIDGDELKYNNKTEFENDLIEKFPFIKYLDIFFIAAGSSNLSSQLSSARCIELLSKFYRLDTLTYLSNKANDRLNEELSKLRDKQRDLDKTQGAINIVDTRIQELSEVDLTEETKLLSELNECNELRNKRDEYLNWNNSYKAIVARCSELETIINTYASRLELDIDSLKSRYNAVNKEIAEIDESLELQSSRFNKLVQLTKSNNTTLEEATKIREQVKSIDNGICPTCGAKLTSAKLESKRAELMDVFNRLKSSYESQIAELNSYSNNEKSDGYFKKLLDELKVLRKTKSDESSLIFNKISQYELAKSDKETYDRKLAAAESEKIELESHKIEEVILPYNLSETEDDLRNKLNLINHKKDYISQKSNLESEYNSILSEYNEIDKLVERYNDYMLLMSNTGEVIEEVLKRLATKFSSNELKYEVSSGVSYNKRWISFDTYYNVKGNWRIYSSLSSGQKQICDLDFLSNLFATKMGFLVLDEYLRHLDENNFPKCMDILMKMKVGVMIIATHDINITNYTKRILLELNDKGETISKIL